MGAIFKRDFRGLLTTPIGYVFIGAFLCVLNLYFCLTNIANGFGDLSGVYGITIFVLVVLAPVLTMRLFSEEYKAKTDQMLLTAPVRIWDVVLGKFFAAMGVFLIALLGTLTWPLIISAFGGLSGATVVGNLVAVLFATSTFIAIGLFVSSLTESQVIAVIGSFGIFAVLLIVDFLAAQIQVSWIRTVISWLSIYSRFTGFTNGLFSLADIVYYLSVTAVFLFLTTRVLEKKRWS